VAPCFRAALAGLLTLAGTAHPQTPSHPSPSAASFDEVAARAEAAREGGRLDEARVLYREAVLLRPDWAEGWWFLGTLAYDADRHAECREALGRFVAIEPEAGPAWALRGLCDFGLRDWSASARHLDEAIFRGPVSEEPLWRVAFYHRVLLHLRSAEFERAVPVLTELVQGREWTGELVLACGLHLLRRDRLPSDVPPEDLPLVRQAGRAQCATLARRHGEAEAAFRELLERYPKERHVHYAHGVLLVQQGSREAIAAFRREIELHPDHVLARVELAFNLITHGRPEEARRQAEQAVRLDPVLFVSHLALGRALVETGELTLGVFELETAARLAPGVPETHLALSRAYARAGRTAEAERASARFHELEAARRARGGPTSAPAEGPSSEPQ